MFTASRLQTFAINSPLLLEAVDLTCDNKMVDYCLIVLNY